MEFVTVLVVAALVFGVCFLVDKGFTKLFRSGQQHKSGKAVRLSKHYGSMGLIVAVLGVAALFVGLSEPWLMVAAGCLLIVVGAGLVVYYMTFGVYYDGETFLVTGFGKKSTVYRFADICCQQLYNSGGNIVMELHMADGKAVQLQSGMDGVYPFLDHAFDAWLRQTGRDPQDCLFHDPANSCWFPPVED